MLNVEWHTCSLIFDFQYKNSKIWKLCHTCHHTRTWILRRRIITSMIFLFFFFLQWVRQNIYSEVNLAVDGLMTKFSTVVYRAMTSNEHSIQHSSRHSFTKQNFHRPFQSYTKNLIIRKVPGYLVTKRLNLLLLFIKLCFHVKRPWRTLFSVSKHYFYHGL